MVVTLVILVIWVIQVVQHLIKCLAVKQPLRCPVMRISKLPLNFYGCQK